MNEFSVIEKYFAPLSRDGLKNDAAVLQIPAGHELVVSSDTLNAGTHFMEDAAPADIAHKALRSNLSDLASMGADPLSYQLNLAFPEKPSEKFLAEFTRALAADQREFNIFCSGGDTTSIKGPLSISITVLGLVPTGQSLGRKTARSGEQIVLSGPVGDAFIGLQVLQGKLQSDDADYFIGKYYRPRPRLDLIKTIRGYATAAIDISDGLIADLGHLCNSATLYIGYGVFSPQAHRLLASGLVTQEQLLTGGDDYELILTVPAGHMPPSGLEPIGMVESGDAGIVVIDPDGRPLSFSHKGWTHF